MCTVTLIPLTNNKKGFVLTSNRDEAANRLAIPPEFYQENGLKMLYPKDTEAGGSWIGLSEASRLICLLNGAFESHERKSSYRLSRGVVLKDLLSAPDLDDSIARYKLENIEPFTMILVDWKESLRFIELVWDGNIKYVNDLEMKEHLWSSSPLYTPGMKNLRENWFSEFLTHKKISPESIWDFHHTGGRGDNDVALIMDRGFVKTHSISQIVKGEETTFLYEDLLTRKITRKIFPEI